MSSPDTSPLLSPPPSKKQPHGRSRLKVLAVVIAVLVVASVGVALAYPALTHRTTPLQSSTPVFAFLPASVLNSTYGTGFRAFNDSGNVSSFLGSAPVGILREEMQEYVAGNASNPSAAVATVILQMNSSSTVSKFMPDFVQALKNSSPQLILNGTLMGFAYSMYNISIDNGGIASSAQIMLAHDGTFVILMMFFDPTVTGVVHKDTTVFNDQVKFMFPADNAPSTVPMSIAVSGSVDGIPFSAIITIILTFAAGLFIGLAVKKGLTALILGIVGIVIAGYVGIAFVPKISLTYEIHKWSSFFLTYVSTVKFGAIQLTLSVVLFLIGLAIGLWKG